MAAMAFVQMVPGDECKLSINKRLGNSMRDIIYHIIYVFVLVYAKNCRFIVTLVLYFRPTIQ